MENNNIEKIKIPFKFKELFCNNEYFELQGFIKLLNSDDKEVKEFFEKIFPILKEFIKKEFPFLQIFLK